MIAHIILINFILFISLDTLFATFDHAIVDLDGITDIEVGNVWLHLLFLDLADDIHGLKVGWRGGGTTGSPQWMQIFFEEYS